MKSLLMTVPYLALHTVLWATIPVANAQSAAEPSRQEMLQRVYTLRMRFDNERTNADNEARANSRLVTQSGNGQVDSPTVSGLRQQTNVQLSRFEQQFRCLDVDVEANSGNTVVICGDNAGDITGSNVAAERDIVTLNGGTR